MIRVLLSRHQPLSKSLRTSITRTPIHHHTLRQYSTPRTAPPPPDIPVADEVASTSQEHTDLLSSALSRSEEVREATRGKFFMNWTEFDGTAWEQFLAMEGYWFEIPTLLFQSTFELFHQGVGLPYAASIAVVATLSKLITARGLWKQLHATFVNNRALKAANEWERGVTITNRTTLMKKKREVMDKYGRIGFGKLWVYLVIQGLGTVPFLIAMRRMALMNEDFQYSTALWADCALPDPFSWGWPLL